MVPSLQQLTLQEIQNMIQAEEMAFIDTGFYHTLENLDDLSVPTQQNEFDYISYNGDTVVIDITTGKFKPERENLLDLPNRWLGPYITYQSGRISVTGAGYDPGTPVDFWGNPYLIFSPLGLLRPPAMSVTLEYYGDTFDRYAIVSLGPDGVKSSDDIMATFGTTPTRTIISSALLADAPTSPILMMRIKGYNFGKNTNESTIRVNGEERNNLVISWVQTEILMNISSGRIPQMGLIQVTSPSGISENFSYSLPTFLQAYDWEIYN